MFVLRVIGEFVYLEKIWYVIIYICTLNIQVNIERNVEQTRLGETTGAAVDRRINLRNATTALASRTTHSLQNEDDTQRRAVVRRRWWNRTDQWRGHSWKLVKSHRSTDARRFFFSARVINRWNSLSQEAVDASSVNVFKNQLDRIRNSRMGFFMD